MKKKEILNKAINAAAEKAGIDGKMPDKIDVNFTKRLKADGFWGIILAIAVFIFSASAWLYNSIPKTSTSIGSAFGKVTGLAAGSFQAALDVPDTQKAELTKEAAEAFAHDCGQLEIMRSEIQFLNLYSSEDTWYSLNSRNAEAVFTVDLSQAEYDGNTLSIPEIDIALTLAEESETPGQYTASQSEDPSSVYTASVTSAAASSEEALATLRNDSAFMDPLRQRTEEKIKGLFKALFGEETEISISWKEVIEDVTEEEYSEEIPEF